MHAESFHGFVVLNNRVETFLLQFLPILAQFIFIVRVEQKKEILDIRDHLFESEVAFGAEEVIGLFLQFSN